jgi:hypothetical protein
VESSLSGFGSFDFEKDVLPIEFKGILAKEKKIFRVTLSGKSESAKAKWEELRQGTKEVIERETNKLWSGKELNEKEMGI